MASPARVVVRMVPRETYVSANWTAWQKLHKLAAKASNAYASGLIHYIEKQKKQVDIQGLVAAIEKGNVAAATKAIGNAMGVDPFVDVDEIREIGLAKLIKVSAEVEAKALKTAGVLSGKLRFDLVDPLAVAWAKQGAGELIKYVSQTQKDVVKLIISNAIQNGVPPRIAAREIKTYIGLLPQHAKAVMDAMARARAAGMSEARVTAMGDRYARRLHVYRARMIARTETIRAAFKGARSTWAAAAAQGLFDASRAGVRWVTGPNERTCPVCLALNGKIRRAGPGDTFPGGYRQPPDPHPHCTCAIVLVPKAFPPAKKDEGAGEASEAGVSVPKVSVPKVAKPKGPKPKKKQYPHPIGPAPVNPKQYPFPIGPVPVNPTQYPVPIGPVPPVPAAGALGDLTDVTDPWDWGTGYNERVAKWTDWLKARSSTIKAQNAIDAGIARDINAEAKRTLVEYTGSTYTTINQTLRGKISETNTARRLIRDMDHMMATHYHAVEKDMIVYRGFSGHAIRVGDTVRDLGFVSTSLDPEVSARIFTRTAGEPIAAIILRKGRRMVIPNNPGEREMVLPRGSWIKIIKDTGRKTGSGNPIYLAEVVDGPV